MVIDSNLSENSCMITLREALEQGKLEEFLTEREEQAPADEKAFHATLNSMAGKCKPAPETSAEDECDD